jgi:glycine oxidase
VTRSNDVVVVGGGIIGLALAREAARAGLSVLVLEKGEPGRESSSAAAGILAPQIEAETAHPLLSLCLASRDLYPDFAREVRSESGIDPDLMERGTLVLARDPESIAALDRRHAFQRSVGLEVERLAGDDLRRLEPDLAPVFEAGLFLPRDYWIDNVRLLRALRLSAERAGASLVTGVRATGLVVERGKTRGVETEQGTHPAGAVVIAAGAWSGEIGARDLPPLPMHPVRGQIVSLSPRDSAPRRVLFAESSYLVPRNDGQVLVGSTMETVGFDKRVTAEAIAALIDFALSLIPALRRADFHSAWAGLRPATDDGLPAIGAGPVPGLLYACGHLRNGILLAPLTARIVVRLLRGEGPGLDLSPFDPTRFARSPGRDAGANLAGPPGRPG